MPRWRRERIILQRRVAAWLLPSQQRAAVRGAAAAAAVGVGGATYGRLQSAGAASAISSRVPNAQLPRELLVAVPAELWPGELHVPHPGAARLPAAGSLPAMQCVVARRDDAAAAGGRRGMRLCHRQLRRRRVVLLG
eukprot:363396-Chlamydomonas_euryale.AAC.9